jgi:uncharacterized protein
MIEFVGESLAREAAMTKTLIIPGIDGSPEPHWQHWWAMTDARAILVAQENWSHPAPDEWETEVAGAIIAHPGSVLVAHSRGCILVARLLQNWPELRIKAALLVAPADVNQSHRLTSFAPIPQGRLEVPTTVVASRNDPWMSITQAADLARSWGADFVDLGFAGHINVASGFGPWPLGKKLRDGLLLRASAQAATQRPSLGNYPDWRAM